MADELGQRLRSRQLAAAVQQALGPGQLEGFERKQRVATGALAQRRRKVCACHAGQVEGVDQFDHLRHIQRGQRHMRERRCGAQGIDQRLQARAGGAGPQAQAPADGVGHGGHGPWRGQQALQQLQAGAV